MKWFRNLQFRTRLIILFLLFSLIPLLSMEFISSMYANKIIQSKIEDLVEYAQNRTTQSISSVMTSYEELSMQAVLDEELIRLIKMSNKTDGFERAFYVNSIRDKLSSLIYAKDGLLAATVITKSGLVISSDRILGLTNLNLWNSGKPYSPADLYRETVDAKSLLWTTSNYNNTLNSKVYNLFNLSRKITGFYELDPSAIIILSVNEEVLYKLISDDQSLAINPLMIDTSGQIISFKDKTKIGSRIQDMKSSSRMTDETALARLLAKPGENSQDVKISIRTIEGSQYQLVNAINQKTLFAEMTQMQHAKLIIIAAFIVVTLLMIYRLSLSLSQSIYVIVGGIKKVQSGNLDVEIQVETHDETAIIADQFNHMVVELRNSIEKLKEQMLLKEQALKQRKDAEIMALEAQINPHFLYNIFDSINWMAIEQEDYKTSNVISKLAMILRYSLYKSNQLVLISEEMTWLEQYLYLQKECLNNIFNTVVEVDPHLAQCYVYKLLMQPIIENAIVHGFRNQHVEGVLEISIHEETADRINITISDNGSGMDREKLKSLRATIQDKPLTSGNGIGFANIAVRLEMYYGQNYELSIESESGKGTIVNLIIPKISQRDLGVTRS